MNENEIFVHQSCAHGDFSGVFEYDGETGYFYLYDVGGATNHKVVGAIHILTGKPDFSTDDVVVRWDVSGRRVGLIIRNQLWAVFDIATGEKCGGNYRLGALSQIPYETAKEFSVS